MKKIILILISTFFLSSGFVTTADPELDTNSKFKAVFIYNFTKYIEWPKTYREGPFIIGVLEDASLYTELSKMAKTKRVSNQSIKIVKFNSIEDLQLCHILYVSKSKSKEISGVLKKMKSNCTLIVTEENGLIDKGAGINFVVKDNRLKFELNTKNIKKNRLKVSSNLEVLAIPK